MTTTTESFPSVEVDKVQSVRPESIARGEGNQLFETYFEFEFVSPLQFVARSAPKELSDHELIIAVQESGSFAFWDGPGEDIYNEMLNE